MVITLNSAATAQTQSHDSIEEPARTGAIKGRVVNESGQPLANVTVSVRAYGSVGQSRITSTDSEGNFQIADLDPAGYQVLASAPAYNMPPRDPNNPQPTYRVGDSVRLELVKGGVITGRVTTPSGEPVIAVRVRAEMIRDNSGQPARYRAVSKERTTDDRGIYRIYGLIPGTYVVSAGGVGNFTFNSSAYDRDAPTYAPSSTHNDAVEIGVGTGQETANVDIRYRGEPGHAVSGTVISPTGISPTTGSNIHLTSVQKGLMQSSYSIFQPSGSTGFAVYGVADGDYVVTAQLFLPGGEGIFSDPKRIKVKGADVTGLELVTKPLGTIKGRVVLEESKTPECKGKLRPSFAEMLVTAWHNEKGIAKDQPPFIFAFGLPSVPDKQGEFTLRNLAAGEYRFSARFFAKYWYLQSISLQSPVNAPSRPPNSSLDKARNWMLVKSDRISGLTITLAEGAASLRGSVRPSEGETIPARINVHLLPAEKDKAEDVLRFFTVAVDADRKFSVSNVPPGRYLAFATVVADTDSTAISKLRLPDEVEARVKLRREAEAAKTEIELKPCQNLTDYQLILKETTRVSRPD